MGPQIFSKIDPNLKNFLTYHPTLNSAIDRSRRALQLCSGVEVNGWSLTYTFCDFSTWKFSTIEKSINSMVPTVHWGGWTVGTMLFIDFFQKNFWFSKIDPYLKNFLTYHPTLNSAIDRSRRALQLCSGGRGEWVKSHLHFLSIFEKFCW